MEEKETKKGKKKKNKKSNETNKKKTLDMAYFPLKMSDLKCRFHLKGKYNFK